VTYPLTAASAEAMFEAGLEAGADDVETNDDEHVVTCAPEDLSTVRDALEAKFGPGSGFSLIWRPSITAPVAEDAVPTLFKLLETLEDSDDVQNVYANFDIAEDVLARVGV